MARALNKLTARAVQTTKEPGRHSDGGGLYLIIDQAGRKRWVVFYTWAGKRREMGAGSVDAVTLSRAREIAAEVRTKVAAGTDPISERSIPLPQAAKAVSFGDVALRFMADRETEWRNPKHRSQWRQTLETQAGLIWGREVASIDTNDVLAILRPIWTVKAETGRRLRGRIERVLDAARAAGHRSGENPARWRGHLDAILPKAKRLTRGHHAAMRYQDVPAFVAELRKRPALAARALELAILTAARSGEIRGMPFGEVDLASATWTIPAKRMKGGREHRVPLSPRAMEILSSPWSASSEPSALVFPSQVGKPHSDMVFKALLKRMGQDTVTTHGFRSSFRDWAAEETDHPREVIEAALAHLVGDDTERAYRRGDALAKRRVLMDHWATFLSATGDEATKA